jgi:hypothetical protein
MSDVSVGWLRIGVLVVVLLLLVGLLVLGWLSRSVVGCRWLMV